MRDVRLIDANKLLGIFCADCGMREGNHSNSCEKGCDIYDTIMACPTVEAHHAHSVCIAHIKRATANCVQRVLRWRKENNNG